MKLRIIVGYDPIVAKIFLPRSENHNMTNHITEEDGVMIAEWCKEHNCGRRTSFNMFEFRNKNELSMFMLKWS
jgi:hypothetical protein